MDAQELRDRQHELTVVDVRDDQEWSTGHIEGSQHVAMDELPGRLGELDRSRPVALVCRSGNRSGQAAEFLSQQGYTADNVEGGLQEWSERGLPLVTPDGSPGEVA